MFVFNIIDMKYVTMVQVILSKYWKCTTL